LVTLPKRHNQRLKASIQSQRQARRLSYGMATAERCLKKVASAILADVEPWLPARRTGMTTNEPPVISERFARRSFFPGGRLPACRRGRHLAARPRRSNFKNILIWLGRFRCDAFSSGLEARLYVSQDGRRAKTTTRHRNVTRLTFVCLNYLDNLHQPIWPRTRFSNLK
jgi:hypothetical protein